MSDQYILIGQTPVPCDDLMEWGRWMESNDRRVFLTKVGEWFVSTVFLGLDHNYRRLIGGDTGPPILFETMAWKECWPYCSLVMHEVSGLSHEITREWNDDLQERCATWAEAEAQHQRAVLELLQPGDQIVPLEPAPLPGDGVDLAKLVG